MMSRQQLLGGDHAAAETRAQFLHLALGPGIDQRLVGGIERISQLEGETEEHPLPVTLVRRDEQHRLPLRQVGLHLVEVEDAARGG